MREPIRNTKTQAPMRRGQLPSQRWFWRWFRRQETSLKPEQQHGAGGLGRCGGQGLSSGRRAQGTSRGRAKENHHGRDDSKEARLAG